MTKVATNIIYYTSPPIFKKQRKKVNISAKKAVFDLKNYLYDLKKREITKDYAKNNSYIIGCIFRNHRSLSNLNELNQYVKANLFIAIDAFDSLILLIEKKEKIINSRVVNKYSELIREFIFDLKPYVEFLERKSNKHFEFFRGGKSYSNTAFELFKTCEALYWYPNIMQQIIAKKDATNLNVFALRQSLEIKFKRIFGVSELYNKDLTDVKLKHDFFPNFISENISLIDLDLPGVNMTEVLKIYSWTNYTIHNAVNPSIWQIYYAIKICNSFFKNGEYKRNDNKQILSIYASVKIKNNDALMEKLLHKIFEVNKQQIFCFANINQEAIIDEK